MKKLFTILTIFLLFAIPSLAQEETEDITEDDSGIQADSPLYFLDKTMERINLALTFNKEKRAKLELSLANERLREVNLMIQKKKLEVAKKVQTAHQQRLLKARERIQELKEETDEETVAELETEIESQELLVEDTDTASLLNDFSESDKIKVKEILDEMRKISKETREKLQEKREELEQLKPQFREKIEAAKKAKLRPEIQNRIKTIERKIEISKDLLELRPEIEEELEEILDLAEDKLDEAEDELDLGNYEEAKALTLEANKLAVLVRGKSLEAKGELGIIKEIALNRERIIEQLQNLKLRKEGALEQNRERLKNAIETLKEKEEELKERQEKIIERRKESDDEEKDDETDSDDETESDDDDEKDSDAKTDSDDDDDETDSDDEESDDDDSDDEKDDDDSSSEDSNKNEESSRS